MKGGRRGEGNGKGVDKHVNMFRVKLQWKRKSLGMLRNKSYENVKDLLDYDTVLCLV